MRSIWADARRNHRAEQDQPPDADLADQPVDRYRTGFSRWWSAGLAVAAGLTLAGAFPPVGFWPLAIAGPALLTAALWRKRPMMTLCPRTDLGRRVLLRVAVLAGQRRLVRLGGAGRARDADLRGHGARAAAAHAAARLAARRGGLVGGAGSGARPVPVGRVPVGTAGDEPGVGADGGLGHDRRPARAHLPARPVRSLPGLPGHHDPIDWAKSSLPRAAPHRRLGDPVPALVARRAAGAARQPDAGLGAEPGAERGRGHHPGQRAALAQPARPAPRHHGDRQPRRRDRSARRRRQGRSPARTRHRDLAGELHRHRPEPVAADLRHDLAGRRRDRPPGPRRRRAL